MEVMLDVSEVSLGLMVGPDRAWQGGSLSATSTPLPPLPTPPDTMAINDPGGLGALKPKTEDWADKCGKLEPARNGMDARGEE